MVSPSRILQLRGQRPIRDLDGEEFEFFLVIGARHAVGTQQRPALDLEADHRKLTVLEAETGIAGGPEAEKRIGPVADRKNLLSIECSHGFSFFLTSRCRTFRFSGLEVPKISGFLGDLALHLRTADT